MATSLIDLAGYAAAALVFLTFSMKTLLPLRLVAIASNVAFLAYGYLAGLTPILILHGLLLPLNLWRTWEQVQLLRRIKDALEAPARADILLPHMTMQRFDTGDVVFHKGDVADRLYYVVSGRVEIVDVGPTLEAGALLGEIGLFTDERQRTASVRAVEPAELCWIGKETVLGLYQKHPDFGLVLTKLIAQRMAQNQAHLQARLAELEPAKDQD